MSEKTEPAKTVEKPIETKKKVEKAKVRDWKKYFNVRESTKVDTVNRLDIMVGVNEYKGQTAIFMCKITDRGRCQSFNPLPPYLWEKAVPVISGYIERIGEIERKAMVADVTKELERLKALGVDISALVDKVA